jgi:NAD(P)-dependent dehydrogenase (short-subunit alcohol dehydrogenase family)
MHSKSWHSLEGKTIWVSGGAGYLGSAITEQLDAHCAKVLCFDLADFAEKLVKDRNLTHTIPRRLDVTDTANTPAAIEEMIAAHGVPDGYVHLPTASSKQHTLESLPLDDFKRTFERGLVPTFAFCRAIAEKMKPRGSGSIVLFASMYGMVAPDPRTYREPMKPNPIDYGAAKAAIIQMTRYFAVHYGAANLRFNCITPGPFPNPNVQKSDPQFIARLSEKTALRRIGRNTEIAGPTLFLLTDSASYVTGQSLVVDGGWTAW